MVAAQLSRLYSLATASDDINVAHLTLSNEELYELHDLFHTIAIKLFPIRSEINGKKSALNANARLSSDKTENALNALRLLQISLAKIPNIAYYPINAPSNQGGKNQSLQKWLPEHLLGILGDDFYTPIHEVVIELVMLFIKILHEHDNEQSLQVLQYVLKAIRVLHMDNQDQIQQDMKDMSYVKTLSKPTFMQNMQILLMRTIRYSYMESNILLSVSAISFLESLWNIEMTCLESVRLACSAAEIKSLFNAIIALLEMTHRTPPILILMGFLRSLLVALNHLHSDDRKEKIGVTEELILSGSLVCMKKIANLFNFKQGETPSADFTSVSILSSLIKPSYQQLLEGYFTYECATEQAEEHFSAIIHLLMDLFNRFSKASTRQDDNDGENDKENDPEENLKDRKRNFITETSERARKKAKLSNSGQVDSCTTMDFVEKDILFSHYETVASWDLRQTKKWLKMSKSEPISEGLPMAVTRIYETLMTNENPEFLSKYQTLFPVISLLINKGANHLEESHREEAFQIVREALLRDLQTEPGDASVQVNDSFNLVLKLIITAPSSQANWRDSACNRIHDYISSILSSKSANVHLKCTLWKKAELFMAAGGSAEFLKTSIIESDENTDILEAAASAISRAVCCLDKTLSIDMTQESTFCTRCDTTDSLGSHQDIVSDHEFVERLLKNSSFLLKTARARIPYLRGLTHLIKHEKDLSKLCLKSVWRPDMYNCLISGCKEAREASSDMLRSFFSHSLLSQPCASVSIKTRILRENSDELARILSGILCNMDQIKLDALASVFQTMGDIGKFSQESVLRVVLEFFLAVMVRQNILLRATAFDQIRCIARWKNLTPTDVCIPHISYFSCYLVSHIDCFRSNVENVVETIFCTSLQQFLRTTLEHTLPHLILKQRTDSLNAISSIVKIDSANELCVPELHNILARVMLEDRHALQFFLDFLNGDSGNISMVTLIKSCSLDLVKKLAIELGNTNSDMRIKAINALKIVQACINTEEDVVTSKNVSDALSEATSKIDDQSFALFLRNYLLGILANLNRNLGSFVNARRFQSVLQKQKIIRSLTVLIQLIGEKVHTMITQVMATLQMTLDIPPLRSTALASWEALVLAVGVDTLGPLMNQVAIVLLEPFDQYSTEDIQRVVSIFDYMIVQNERSLYPYFIGLPSLATYSCFAEASRILAKYEAKQTLTRILDYLVHQGIPHDNAMVSYQSLNRLCSLLQKNQDWLHSLASPTSVDPMLMQLAQTLLDTTRRYNGIRMDIQLLCCECLGILGAIDPVKLYQSGTGLVKMPMGQGVKLDNFISKEETVDFVCSFLEKQLSPVFRSTQSTMLQGHLSFAIQELLKFCGFTEELIDKPRSRMDIHTERLQKKWSTFSKSARDIFKPLLTSKYQTVFPAPSNAVYPIYPRKSSHTLWLQSWVGDLINKAKNGKNSAIFAVCRNLKEDPTIAVFLLPHVVLDILQNGSNQERKDVLSEFLSVLGHVKDDQEESQTVFLLIDHLAIWLRNTRRRYQHELLTSKKTKVYNPNVDLYQDAIKKVDELLDGIPQLMMAEASFKCEAYARALMHFEQHFQKERETKSEVEIQPLYGQLQLMYSKLDEVDGLEGITSKLTSPTLDQQILQHESAGMWTAAQTCNELALQRTPGSLKYHVGLLKCLRNLNHMETMLTHIEGSLHHHPEWQEPLSAFAVEASWRLGRWESLEHHLSQPSKPTFETMIGQVLLSARSVQSVDQLENTRQSLQKVRETLVAPLAAASMESYRRAYDVIVKLHILQEIESVFKLVADFSQNGTQPHDNGQFAANLEALLKRWDTRLKVTTPAFRVREPILSLRRIVLQKCSTLNETVSVEIGRMWLYTAKLCRKAGYEQSALGSLLHALELKTPNVHLEKAKHVWNKGLHHKAIFELQNFLAKVQQTDVSDSGNNNEDVVKAYDIRIDTLSEKYIRAKTKLRLGSWMEETNVGISNAILNLYMSASHDQPEWEKSYYYVGKHYNQYLETERSNPSRSLSHTTMLSLVYYTCKNYGRALTYGTRYLYQTLPKILTLWLDVGQKQKEQPLADDKNWMNQLTKLMVRLAERLPSYQFLTSFAQIVSRMTHPNQAVFDIIEKIILRVLLSYPGQALWQLVAALKSTNRFRSSRCETLFRKARETREIAEIIHDATSLTDNLLKLCNHSIDKSKTRVSLTHDVKTNLHEMKNLKMIVPLQSSLTVALPNSSETLSSHKPFPNNLPYIASFSDEVELMPSLMRPRKLGLIDNTGRRHFFLCKPKDDLRKDCRLMEFNSMINKLLKKDSECRKRQLYVRTYAVVPLNEECGLIEWVNNTVAFRHAILKLYEANNLKVPLNQLKQMFAVQNKYEMLTKHLLPKHPPILHKWFLETFPEPTEWFTSRLAFSATTAVMSMVGYIVGLGDRHGENILLDKLTGDCLHVDLNCLFEKGQTFEVPEVVPFRMTHNIVDAFGVTGVEGVFRRCCEESMRVLRANRDSLMSVLETFIHDPLCEWSKNKNRRTAHSTNDVSKNIKQDADQTESETGRKKLTIINKKLQGMTAQAGGTTVTLSVEAQVNELVSQATDLKNLSNMYIGK